MRKLVLPLTLCTIAAAVPARALTSPLCRGRRATVVGTAGTDVLRPGPYDVVAALGGNDVVYGHPAGNAICGGRGSDWIRGTAGGDDIDGGRGHDTIDAGGQADSIRGGRGDDLVIGDRKGRTAGRHGAGADEIRGGRGDDRLYGFGHVDDIYGGSGDDLLAGGRHQDALWPGSGDDLVVGGIGRGRDLVLYSDSPAPVSVDLASEISVGHGTDVLRTVEGVSGTPLADRLRGSGRRDSLYGGGGADHLEGGAGPDALSPDGTALDTDSQDSVDEPADDVVDGGTGSDLVMFAPQDHAAAMAVDLVEGTASGEGFDVLTSVENVAAGAYGGSRIVGTPDANFVYLFLEAADYVSAGAGDDLVVTGAGTDEVDGGDGIDNCREAEVVRNCEEVWPTGEGTSRRAQRAPWRALLEFLRQRIRPAA